MNLDQKYNRDEFLVFLRSFLPAFNKDIRPIRAKGLKVSTHVIYLGKSDELDLDIFEITHAATSDARVSLAMDGFRVMRNSSIYRALVVYKADKGDDWRLSLMTASPGVNEKGKVGQTLSNPRRFSYFLGPNAKINTPYQFIIKQGPVKDFTELQKRFSLEVVNKEFYKKIQGAYYNLVGGTLGEGNRATTFKSVLHLPSQSDRSQQCLEFAVRLIGRLIFCWFLREKKGISGTSLMPKELLSLDAAINQHDYYHKILEPIFFEVLNKPLKSRMGEYMVNPYSLIPYLNGGLFTPHDDDFYKRRNGEQSIYHNTLKIPDKWFEELFDTLELYNFTIDENSSFDEELSIDPEMLGRIFENLLAEINPETGESARKSTGSYYTPRPIVDYMVDESLFYYLKQKTNIEENKLRAVISYDLSDDALHPLDKDEKQSIVDALEALKLLDPACGSGAFPIGALQKIVFILQQIDPEGQLWFKKQVKTTSPEIRRVIEREFSHKNFDYLRKLGIIRENIFGVDIQPIATEISRLRCFLTLVVDERVDDSLENRGIEPLPNLDFKFVTANTLIGLPSANKIAQTGLFEDAEGIKDLKEIRDAFFTAYGPEREQLRLQFVQKQNKMFQKLISQKSLGHAELTTKLTSWEPFSNQSSSWFDPEWMFGITEGFDVVIGNPPYLRVQGIQQTQSEFMDYYKKHFKSAQGSFDLYALFIERGYHLLNKTGQFSYIVPHKFFQASFGEALRKLLTIKKALRQVVRFGSSQVFDEATTYTCLLFLSAQQNEQFDMLEVKTLERGADVLNAARQRTEHPDYSFDRLPVPNQQIASTEWNFALGSDSNVLRRMKQHKLTLFDITRKIFVGLQTSYDKIYVMELISESKESVKCYSKHTGAEIEIEKGLIKPFLMGKDVHRYEAVEAKNVVIFPYSIVDGKSELMPPPFIKKNYPLGWKYLKKCENDLANREHGKMQGDNFYSYIYPKNLSEFAFPKIMTPDICGKPEMTIDLNGLMYHTTTIYSFVFKPDLKINEKHMLGLLNSKVMWYFISMTGAVLRGDYLRFKTEYLKPFPVPEYTHKQENIVETLVEYVLFLKSQKSSNDINIAAELKVATAYFEQLIDCIVYELYFPELFNDPYSNPTKQLLSARLPALKLIKGNKAIALRDLFKILYEPTHPLRKMAFFIDNLEEIRAIEAKSKNI